MSIKNLRKNANKLKGRGTKKGYAIQHKHGIGRTKHGRVRDMFD
jgi:hypothetical protein